MELSYKQLETTLSAHLRISPDRISTFRSRIKQLQRLEFPEGVNVGRGTKMVYTGAHLLKLVTAFELIGIGFPAQLATTLVERHWTEFSVAYAVCLRNRLRWYFDKAVYARLILRGLFDIQFGTDAPSRVIIEDGEHLSEIMGTNTNRTAYCYPILCISDLAERVLKIACDLSGVPHAHYDQELISWIPHSHPEWLMFRGNYRRTSAADALEILSRTYDRPQAEKFLEQLSGLDGEESDVDPEA